MNGFTLSFFIGFFLCVCVCVCVSLCVSTIREDYSLAAMYQNTLLPTNDSLRTDVY